MIKTYAIQNGQNGNGMTFNEISPIKTLKRICTKTPHKWKQQVRESPPPPPPKKKKKKKKKKKTKKKTIKHI